MKLIIDYLLFVFQSKPLSAHRIHSPFLYKLLRYIFENKKLHIPEIENIRNNLLNSTQIIDRKDFGQGSKFGNSNKRKIRSIVKRSSITKKQGVLLYLISQRFKPKTILELGTSVGLSTMYLAKDSEAKIYTIDACSSSQAVAKENFNLLNFNNITTITENIDVVLDDVLSEIRELELVYFDANHNYSATIRYFNKCLNYINNNSIFIFDDIYWSKEMKKAWNEIISYQKITLSINFFHKGIVFFNKDLSKQDFKIRYL